MKITEITRVSPGLYAHVCPKCGAICASASDPEYMPEFSVCGCDRSDEKESVYELLTENGRTMIRRNTYPRFTGEVTMGTCSDIEHVRWEDKCGDAATLARAMKKAAEFLRKSSRMRQEEKK